MLFRLEFPFTSRTKRRTQRRGPGHNQALVHNRDPDRNRDPDHNQALVHNQVQGHSQAGGLRVCRLVPDRNPAQGRSQDPDHNRAPVHSQGQVLGLDLDRTVLMLMGVAMRVRCSGLVGEFSCSCLASDGGGPTSASAGSRVRPCVHSKFVPCADW